MGGGLASGNLNENGTNVYRGEVDGGGKFYFEATYKKGEPTKMGYVIAIRVSVQCAEGGAKATFAHEVLPLEVKVRKRRFALDSGEVQVAVFGEVSVPRPFNGNIAGRLNKDGKGASGTLEFGSVDLSEELHDCSTDGSRKWEAKLSTKFAPH